MAEELTITLRDEGGPEPEAARPSAEPPSQALPAPHVTAQPIAQPTPAKPVAQPAPQVATPPITQKTPEPIKPPEKPVEVVVKQPHWTDELAEEMPVAKPDHPGAAARRAYLADVGKKTVEPKATEPETMQAGSMGVYATEAEYEASLARLYAKLERSLQARLDEQTHRDEVSSYKAAQEELDARKKLTAEIRALNEARRKERLALEAMTPEERILHLGEKEAERQRESGAVKAYAAEATGTAQEKREAQQVKDEDYAAKMERRAEAAAEKERARQEAKQARDEDYFAKEEARAEERDAKEASRREAQQAKDEDFVARRDKKDAERAELKAKREDAEADRLGKQFMRGIERDEKEAQHEAKEAEDKKFDWAGPFAPTVKRYAQMGDAAQKWLKPKAQEEKEAEPATSGSSTKPSAGGTPKAAEAAEEAGAGTAVAEAVPEIAAVVEAVKLVANVLGGIEKAVDLGLAMQENVMQGGPHQASKGMKIAAQAESATVDWIPIVGPALGKIASFGTEMTSKAVQAVENVAIGTAEQIKTASTAMASIATFDSKALVAQMGELAEKRLPVFGVVVHAATDSVMQLAGATETAANRLASYSGTLAQQQAEHEIILVMRELQRAQRFGENVGAAKESQFRMEMKISEISDRFVPFQMAISEKLFNVVEGIATLADKALVKTLEASKKNLEQLAANNPHGALAQVIALINAALGEMSDDNLGRLWDDFANLPNTITTEAPTMAPALGGAINAPAGF